MSDDEDPIGSGDGFDNSGGVFTSGGNEGDEEGGGGIEDRADEDGEGGADDDALDVTGEREDSMLVGEGGEYRQIETLELKYPEWKSNPKSAGEKLKEKSDLEIKNNLESEHFPNSQDHGLWGKIRQIFIKTEGEYGEALDNHWISKLDVKIDEQAVICNVKYTIKSEEKCATI